MLVSGVGRDAPVGHWRAPGALDVRVIHAFGDIERGRRFRSTRSRFEPGSGPKGCGLPSCGGAGAGVRLPAPDNHRARTIMLGAPHSSGVFRSGSPMPFRPGDRLPGDFLKKSFRRQVDPV